MLDNPHLYIDAFSKAGADLITVHIEPSFDHINTIKKIHSLGKKLVLQSIHYSGKRYKYY